MPCTKHLWLLCLTIAAAVNPIPSPAQDLRICESVVADPDGDGFGWQYFEANYDADNNLIPGTWDTCIVTSETTSAPVVVNPLTGVEVNLQRAFWNPNSDIASRTMRCEFHVYKRESMVFEERPDFRQVAFLSFPLVSDDYYHAPLLAGIQPENIAFIGGPDPDSKDGYIPVWGVQHGIYEGVSPLDRSAYVELVAHNSTAVNAVRVWYNGGPGLEDPAFHLCYDKDGDPMLPTGSTENPGELVNQNDVVVTLPAVIHESEPPVIIDRETGLQIEFISDGRWSYKADIGQSIISCVTRRWDETSGTYELFDIFPDNQTYTFHPYNGGDAVYFTRRTQDEDGGTWDTDTIDITDGILRGFPEDYTGPNVISYLESTSVGFRVWGAGTESSEFDGESFRNCTYNRHLQEGFRGTRPFTPTVFTQSTQDSEGAPDGTTTPGPDDTGGSSNNGSTETTTDDTVVTGISNGENGGGTIGDSDTGASTSTNTSGGGSVSALFLAVMMLVASKSRRRRACARW